MKNVLLVVLLLLWPVFTTAAELTPEKEAALKQITGKWSFLPVTHTEAGKTTIINKKGTVTIDVLRFTVEEDDTQTVYVSNLALGNTASLIFEQSGSMSDSRMCKFKVVDGKTQLNIGGHNVSVRRTP